MDNESQEAKIPMPGAPLTRSVGATLSAARQARGISVEDVSHALKLSVAQLNAIEADDHSHLPAPVFVRGFIRSYARLLNVDIMPLLPEKAPVAVPADERLMHHRPGVSLERRRNMGLPALLGGAMCVLLGLAYYEFVINAPPAGSRISNPVPSREAPFAAARNEVRRSQRADGAGRVGSAGDAVGGR